MSEPLPYRLLVFDWDGTLEDSVGAISRSIQRTLQAAGLPDRSLSAIRDVIGLHFEQGLASLYPDRNPVALAELCRRNAVSLPALDEVHLFEKTSVLLESLVAEGYWLAVATGKSRRGLDEALDRHRLADHFVITRTANEARSKPDPEMLLSILDYTGVSAPETLMIGDSTHDLLMAQSAGCDSIGVSSGVHSVATLQQAQCALSYMESVQDLPPWLKQR